MHNYQSYPGKNMPSFMHNDCNRCGSVQRFTGRTEEAQVPCTQGYYFGYPNQVAPSNGDLMFLRYNPASTEEATTMVTLPRGTYQISYGVNGSPAKVTPPPGDTSETDPLPVATVGIAPKINGVTFPRGGSFATIPYGFGTIGSAPLGSTFMVVLPQATNTVGFCNTAKDSFATDYQLLNITITRICN